MTVLRAAVAAALTLLSTSACTSFAKNCAEPPLVTTSGDPLGGGEIVLHLWQPHGQNETLPSGQAYHGASVSPDGSAVAFQRTEGEYSDTSGYPKSRVAVLSLDTGDVTPVSADLPDSNVRELHWSSDGSEIAFVRQAQGGQEIVAVRVEDGAERRLLALNDRQSGAFAWSSDGRELLVPTSPSSNPAAGSPQPPSELWRYFIDTGYHVVVVTPHQLIRQIAWSPDERFVAMAANIPDTTRDRLFVLDLETGISSPIDRRRGGAEALTWSGRYLLYTYYVWTPDDQLYLMRWDSRSHERESTGRPGLDDVLTRFGSISAPACS